VMTAKMDAWKEGMEACVGKLEANWENSDVVAEYQEVKAAVEITGTCKHHVGTNDRLQDPSIFWIGGPWTML
jgi:hypothetical protein